MALIAIRASVMHLLAAVLAACDVAVPLALPGDVPDASHPGSMEPPLMRCAPTSAEVNVFGVYETRGDHSAGVHPIGDAIVSIDRQGLHALVLSAYEPTSWHVMLAPGVRVMSIYLIGYYAQTVDLSGVPVVMDSAANDRPACGYSYPYNGAGCDTDRLLARVAATVGEFTTFHGCYHASQWALHADGTATSNCDVVGYRQYDVIRSCGDPGG